VRLRIAAKDTRLEQDLGIKKRYRNQYNWFSHVKHNRSNLDELQITYQKNMNKTVSSGKRSKAVEELQGI
jgi:hypothetical protein